MNYNERSRAWALRVRHIRSFEIKIRNLTRRLFNKQADDVVIKLWHWYRRQHKSIEKSGFALPTAVFDAEKWKEQFYNTYKDAVQEAVEEMGQVYAGEAFNAFNPAVTQAVHEYADFVATEVNKTTRKKLGDTLAEGIRNGEGIRKLVKRVQEVYEDATGRRAITIARTTAFGASNMGLQMGMEQGGWQRKMWLTSRDDRVRPSHRIDGQVVPVDKPFILNDGREMMYPMDFNERCTHIATYEPVTVEQYVDLSRK